MLNRLQRGDTLIEVLFAVTVFSMVIVGALTIMNQGTAAAQRSLEITLVRQQIDSQADTLRFMHDAYVAAYRPGISFNLGDGTTSPAEEWYRMIRSSAMVANADEFNDGASRCEAAPTRSFVVNPRTARFMNDPALKQQSQSYSQLLYRPDGTFTAEGLWIQGVRSQASPDPLQSSVGYIDFHIRACWDSPGAGAPMRSGTIVRLYEPR